MYAIILNFEQIYKLSQCRKLKYDLDICRREKNISDTCEKLYYKVLNKCRCKNLKI